MMQFLIFIFLSQLLTVQSTLPPIIFLPGYAGSLLFATITNEIYIPLECQSSQLPIGIPFRVLGNITLEKYYPNCVQKLMEVNYNEQTGEFFPLTGIEISTNDGYEGIAPVYWPLIQTFNDWGYQLHKNSYGLPYDYRYLSVQSFITIGFIAKLQQRIEQAYHHNNQSKTILIGHSNGGPTLYYFLEAMSLEWKEKYVAAIIGLSGNFLGQMNGIKTFIYSDNEITQLMMNTWEAQYNSLTWGGYLPTEILVTTYFGTESERNYTTSTTDVISLLEQTQHVDWINRYKTTSSHNNRSIPPTGIDLYCLYGTDVDTSSSFIFDENILTQPPIETKYIPGDGNQDWIDNGFCESWRGEIEESGHILETQGFSGVRHMEMYLNDDVLETIHQIVQKYSTSL